MAAHMMTARRKAALRKAQLASARKRKGRGRKAAAASLGVVGLLGITYVKSGVYRRHRDALAMARLVASYENAGTHRNGRPVSKPRMNRRAIYSYAYSENKLYKRTNKRIRQENKQFKRAVKQTIKGL